LQGGFDAGPGREEGRKGVELGWLNGQKKKKRKKGWPGVVMRTLHEQQGEGGGKR